MYYPRSENKGADQLRGYREADLRLCFRLCRLLVFPWGGSIIMDSSTSRRCIPLVNVGVSRMGDVVLPPNSCESVTGFFCSSSAIDPFDCSKSES